MKTLIFITVAALLCMSRPAGAGSQSNAISLSTGAPADPLAEVTAALNASAAAWSAGDLDGFMTIYNDDNSTIFVGGNRIIAGYRAIRDRYDAKYGPAAGAAKTSRPGAAAMGRLQIEILGSRVMYPDHVFIVGRYHVFTAGAPPAGISGLTTLLFERERTGWKIVSDHTD